MKKMRYLILILLAIIVSTGCARKQMVRKPGHLQGSTRIPPPLFSPRTASNFPIGATTGSRSFSSGVPINGDNTASARYLPKKRVIYFDYDKSLVKTKAAKILQAHAAYLKKYPNTFVRLEGHTDERGSREYNLALGDRRANAVKGALIDLGVIENKITSLSYGEEHPAHLGHNKKAWQRNRRVELIYP